MPQGDGTGPQGQGARKGRGMGKCGPKGGDPAAQGQNATGAGAGRGQGRGTGKGGGKSGGRSGGKSGGRSGGKGSGRSGGKGRAGRS